MIFAAFKYGYKPSYIITASVCRFHVALITTYENVPLSITRLFSILHVFFQLFNQTTITPTTDLCDGHKVYYLEGGSGFLN